MFKNKLGLHDIIPEIEKTVFFQLLKKRSLGVYFLVTTYFCSYIYMVAIYQFYRLFPVNRSHLILK